MFTVKEANDIYESLRVISAIILKAIGCLPEPHKPIIRTKKWRHGRFIGILYHYTGGPSGLKSMRWGNHPGWGNKSSSWHVTIFDRIPDNIIGELWVKHASKELRKLFPTPTIIMADWRWGTWHGNWTNDALLGVENRNTGYSGWSRLGTDGIQQLGKEPIFVGGRTWEPYTREQIVSNINLGRLANGFTNNQLDPDWVLPHSAVCGVKADTGLVYPIHTIRNEIFNSGKQDNLFLKKWLQGFELSPRTKEDDDTYWDFTEDVRDDLIFVPWVEAPKELKHFLPTESFEYSANSLYNMGFNTGPEIPDPQTIKKNVRIFQRSTHYWSSGHLGLDGVVGKMTSKALEKRMKQLRISL
jgi:hypothetical protein